MLGYRLGYRKISFGPTFKEPGGVMILKASYGTTSRPGNSTDFNPYFGTDVGIWDGGNSTLS